MDIEEIYYRAVEVGIINDPRGRENVQLALKAKETEYVTSKCREYDRQYHKDYKDCKDYFDKQCLTNPYSDTRILYDSGREPIKKILCAIDVDTAEVLLADRLNSRMEQPIDLIIAHHPEGTAYAKLYDVMKMQCDLFSRSGVPINVVESIMDERMKEVERKIMPYNHTKSVDAARLLGISLMCIHTPADNMVQTYLQRLFDDKKPYMLDDIIDLLMEIDEYKEGMKNGAGPKIVLGDGNRRAGHIYVDMTGGTEGHEDIYETLPLSGINTLVCMHQSEEHRKKAQKYHVNVVIAGHIASDNLGINLLLDQIFRGYDIEIMQAAGFRRFVR
ncbi:MAG: hypothetical protein L3V56_05585 [Candidatus Magnetoovum sp. WYHC-5]|nr:hypothetical protein [Candidatus Magnetoovum sp. WYHC-5]